MEPDFKIEGKGIDTTALEQEIARRVAKRRKAGVYTHEVEAMLAERLPDEEDSSALPPVWALDYAATRALSSWEVTAAYPVETEKRFIKPMVIFAKRLARFWARIAVGPIQREQTAFNRHVATALEALRRRAVTDSAEALAYEEDLGALADSMIAPEESRSMLYTVVECIGDIPAVTVLGPCSKGLLAGLNEHGSEVHRVSAGSSSDHAPGGATTRVGPLAFLSQVSEESIEALLVCELAFWLRPEAMIDLARRSYLALAPRGLLVVALHTFAAGAPAPAWCAPGVVEKALNLAGFEDVSIKSLPPIQGAPDSPSGYVAAARKR